MPAAAGQGAIENPPPPTAVGEGLARGLNYREALDAILAVNLNAPGARERLQAILRGMDRVPAWANPEHPVYDRVTVEVLDPAHLREIAILNLREHIRLNHGGRKKTRRGRQVTKTKRISPRKKAYTRTR